MSIYIHFTKLKHLIFWNEGSTYLHVWLVYNHPMDGEREIPLQTNQNSPNQSFSTGTSINSLCFQIMPRFYWYRNRLDDGERMQGKLDYLSFAVLSWSCGAVHRPRMISRANTYLSPVDQANKNHLLSMDHKTFETSLHVQFFLKRIVYSLRPGL
jgi:hypothetical protein